MTTATETSVLDHTSDAGFRAWTSALTSLLSAVGLVQTGDTGQINLVTVTRPAVSTIAGYQVWRFPDSSLYLKLEYGTHTSATNPLTAVTVGTGSNGSGTLTGQTSTRAFWSVGGAVSATTAYTSYACLTADAFSLCFKQSSYSSHVGAYGMLAIGWDVTGTGARAGGSYGVLRSTLVGGAGGSGIRFQTVRTAAPAATYAENNQYAQVVGDVTSSLAGANIQAYYIWMNAPDTRPFIWANVYITTEIPKNNTFSVAMVGSTARTYLALGQQSALVSFANQTAATYSFAMIYE